MVILKVAGIILLILFILFLLTLVIYFFNLDMKFAAALIKPLEAWYDWSGARRKKKAEKEKEAKQAE